MKFMLDTNICIFIMKKNETVLKRFFAEIRHGVCISSITLSELEYGVEKSTAAARNRANLLAFSTLADIMPFDSFAAHCYGEIRTALEKKGTPIGSLDMLIAAHAKSLGLTLVTNNTKEFARVEGIRLEDWLNYGN
jgi:tRNA(fMet)-specific endonuclease VapC